MKKLLILFDGSHTANGALEIAKQMNESEKILLTGLFLPSVDYTDVLLFYAGGLAGPVYIPTAYTDPQAIEANIQRFKEYCVKHGIEHRVHDVIDGRIKNVVEQESRFADLMMFSGELFYSNLGEETQQEYMEDAMHKAGCPVLIVPENYVEPQNIIIAYDGSDTSVFAAKQFAYLLPQLCDKPAMVLYADTEKDIPDIEGLTEWAARHFKDLTVFRLEAEAKRYFNSWLMDRGNTLVVTGGYARGGLGQLFRKHFVEDVIIEHNVPVFIAHK